MWSLLSGSQYEPWPILDDGGMEAEVSEEKIEEKADVKEKKRPRTNERKLDPLENVGGANVKAMRAFAIRAQLIAIFLLVTDCIVRPDAFQRYIVTSLRGGRIPAAAVSCDQEAQLYNWGVIRQTRKKLEAGGRLVVVPKAQTGLWRLVFDGSAANERIKDFPRFSLVGTEGVAKLITSFTHIGLADFRNWFYQIPINDAMASISGVRTAQRGVGALAVLAMGLKCAPLIATALAYIVCMYHEVDEKPLFFAPSGPELPRFLFIRESSAGAILGIIFVYIDNIHILTNCAGVLQRAVNRITRNCKSLSCKLKKGGQDGAEWTLGSTAAVEVLGASYRKTDVLEVRVAPSKVQSWPRELEHSNNKSRCRTVARMVAIIIYATRLKRVRFSRHSTVLDTTRSVAAHAVKHGWSSFILLTDTQVSALNAGLKWVHENEFAPIKSLGKCTLKESVVATDATLALWGIHYLREVGSEANVSGPTPKWITKATKPKDIYARELWTIFEALRRAPKETHVIVACDNEAACASVNHHYAPSSTGATLVRMIEAEIRLGRKELTAVWVPTEINVADVLTRPLTTKEGEESRRLLKTVEWMAEAKLGEYEGKGLGGRTKIAYTPMSDEEARDEQAWYDVLWGLA
jgi:hypothetical protein